MQVDNRFRLWLTANRSAINILLYCLIGGHLLFIVVINAVSSYTAYNEFHRQPADNATAKLLNSWLQTLPCRYYGRYTGAETGYGFFGINVRSNGVLIGDCGGEALTADFHSYETSLRFFSMANSLTDDFIKPDAHDSLPSGLPGELNNLVFKNIAVTMFQRHHCQDSTIYLSYNVLQFPTLKAVRAGTPARYQLTKLITAHYSLLPHDR